MESVLAQITGAVLPHLPCDRSSGWCPVVSGGRWGPVGWLGPVGWWGPVGRWGPVGQPGQADQGFSSGLQFW